MSELSESGYTHLCTLVEELKPCVDSMRETPQGFVRDQIARLEEYGPGIRISPKQLAWIERLHKEFVGTATHSSESLNSDLTEEGSPDSNDPRFSGEADDIPF